MLNAKPPRIPSYRLHKPSGLAAVRLKGKDFYLGPYGSPESQAKYRRLISEWLTDRHQVRQIGGPVAARQSDLTIDELLVAYWQHAESYYVKNGKASGELEPIRQTMKPMTQLYGNTLVSDFDPTSLKSVRQAMIDAGLCRTVINARVNRIRRIFKWGVENQLVDATVLHALQAVSPLKWGRCNVRESDPVGPVPDAHVDSVLPQISRQVRAMIELQRLSGMRPGEVTIMRGRDIDTTGRIWTYQPESHKTEHHGKARIIYLGPKAQQIIHEFLKPDVNTYLFSPRDVMAEFNQRRKAARRTPMTPRWAQPTAQPTLPCRTGSPRGAEIAW